MKKKHRRRSHPSPRAAAGLLLVLVLAAGISYAFRDRLARGGSAEAFTDAARPATRHARAAKAPAPRPKRAIVPGAEVVVNIPAGRLELRDGGRVVKSYAVSVGQARHSTPVGTYLLATVIWNPWWNPPPESEWAKDRKVTPPGPGNPMGRVKLNIDELYYIHGTTAEGRLGAPASHGCIRMANRDVVDLARRLYRISDPHITDARLAALSADDRRTRESVLARSVRLRVTYSVARVSGDTLRVLPDVYGKLGPGYADQVRSTLAAAGYTQPLTPEATARLLQSAGGSGGAFALADLATLHPRPAPLRIAQPEVRLLGTPAPGTASAAATPADTAPARAQAPTKPRDSVPGTTDRTQQF
jgi:hypothetical protein